METLINKVGIIISGCDKYLPLADIQFHFFRKYWSECPLDIHYITDVNPLTSITDGLCVGNYMTRIPPLGPADWSRNLSMLLSWLNYEYIIYLQDDYFFTEPVDEIRLKKLIEYIMSNDVNYVRFYSCPAIGDLVDVCENLKLRDIIKKSNFRSSLMASIWKKSTLQSLLKKNMGCTPWQFEHNQQNNEYDKFYCVYLTKDGTSDVIKFEGLYGSSSGLGIYPQHKELLRKENIIRPNGDPVDLEMKL